AADVRQKRWSDERSSGPGLLVRLFRLHANDTGLQRQQVGEGIGLPPQLVGYHRRLARNRRYDRYPNTATLDRFNQSPVIAVAGEKHHLVDLLRHLHGVDRQLNFHIAFGPATAIAVEEFLYCLGDDGVSVVVEPIDQWLDGGDRLALDEARIIEGAQKLAAAFELAQQAPKIDVKAERL